MDLTSRQRHFSIFFVALALAIPETVICVNWLAKRALTDIAGLPKLRIAKVGGPAQIEVVRGTHLRSDFTTLKDLPLTSTEAAHERNLFFESERQAEGPLTEDRDELYYKAELVQHLYAWRKAQGVKIPHNDPLLATKQYMGNLENEEVTLEDFNKLMLPGPYAQKRPLFTKWLEKRFFKDPGLFDEKHFYNLRDLIENFIRWARNDGANHVPEREIITNLDIPAEEAAEKILNHSREYNLYRYSENPVLSRSEPSVARASNESPGSHMSTVHNTEQQARQMVPDTYNNKKRAWEHYEELKRRIPTESEKRSFENFISRKAIQDDKRGTRPKPEYFYSIDQMEMIYSEWKKRPRTIITKVFSRSFQGLKWFLNKLFRPNKGKVVYHPLET